MANQEEIEKAARLRRDQTVTVLAVLAGAPMDNLPDDIQAIVRHWLPAIRANLSPRPRPHGGTVLNFDSEIEYLKKRKENH
jgi:hypothetical protein